MVLTDFLDEALEGFPVGLAIPPEPVVPVRRGRVEQSGDRIGEALVVTLLGDEPLVDALRDADGFRAQDLCMCVQTHNIGRAQGWTRRRGPLVIV